MPIIKQKKNKKTNPYEKFNKETIQMFLDDYLLSGLGMKDFGRLTPEQRWKVAESFFNYLAPKMQATTVAMNLSNKDKAIEETLKQLAQENEK